MTCAKMEKRLRLHLNESPFLPLPSVVRAIADELNTINRYPSFFPTSAQEFLAGWLGLDADNIVTGTGSVGVALQVLSASRSSRVVYSVPTFDGYPLLADMTGARKISVPTDNDGGQSLDALAAGAGSSDATIVLCNPHNPTGTALKPAEITRFLKSLPHSLTIIIDEAYIEFADEDFRCDLRELLSCHPQVVVLRTFSKAYGLAGMRIGYGIANSDFAKHVQGRALPFGFSTLAQVAMEASIAALDELQARVEAVRRERIALRSDLRRLGIRVFSSQTNFLWLPWEDGAPDWAKRLDGNGVQIKIYPDQGARLSIGDEAENAIVRSASRLPSAYGDIALAAPL